MQDAVWLARLTALVAQAVSMVELQMSERAKAAERCAAAAEAMERCEYEAAVADYTAARRHDVNEVTLEERMRSDLSKAVATLERRNAARVASRHQLGIARASMAVESWEAAVGSCEAALDREAVYEEPGLTLELVATLLITRTELTAREEARAEAIDLSGKGETLSADGDFAAAAAAYQAGLQLDTQDAELKSELATGLHLAQASDQLKHGRAYMPSQAWEQAIAHFQRGLEHEPELAGRSVLRELRTGLSSCEASKAARDVSTTYAQQLLSRSLRQAFGHQNRHEAEQLCRDGHGHMQRRQYTASPQAIRRCL